EALANAGRHARATSVLVALRRDPGALVVVVRDDGIGFTPNAPAHGVGLATMRERALLVHGELAIESRPGAGTTVQLVLPLVTAATPPSPEPKQASSRAPSPAPAPPARTPVKRHRPSPP